MRQRLSVDSLRSIDTGTYIVAELAADERWQQGEGRVKSVKEHDTGAVYIKFSGSSGHLNTLKVPADGRNSTRLDGAAIGASDQKVTGTYKVDK